MLCIRRLNRLLKNQHHLILLGGNLSVIYRSFRINFKYKSSQISVDPLVLYLSKSNLYIPPSFGSFFKFAVFRLLKNVIMSQIIESRHVYSCPRQVKPPPRFFPKISSSVERGWTLKVRKINNLELSWVWLDPRWKKKIYTFF